MKVFVDTSAWYAYFSEKDAYHPHALAFIELGYELYTSDLVISETLGLIQKRVHKKAAVIAGEFVLDPHIVTILKWSEYLRQRAWKEFKKIKETDISFVDVSSKIAMESLGLRDIFTFDADFVKLGLYIVPTS